MNTKKTEDMTEYSRNYREKNKDKLASYMTNYMKNYYDDRKDQFYEYNKKRREKEFICTCGCQIKWYNKKKHETTKKHLSRMSLE